MDKETGAAIISILIALVALIIALLKTRVKRIDADIDDSKTRTEGERILFGMAATSLRNSERLYEIEQDLSRSRKREEEYLKKIGELSSELTRYQQETSELTRQVQLFRNDLEKCLKENANVRSGNT